MYCPRCSQQQVSEETKFCSRCGFPLGLVSEILSHGGFLPQLAELHKSKKLLTRKNGVVFSILWAMFFVLILCPLFGVADIDTLAGASALIGIFGGAMLMVSSLMLLKREPDNYRMANMLPNANLPNAKLMNPHEVAQRNLPPQQSQTANSYVPPTGTWKAPDTGDFVRRGSVTDGTTKLLEKNE